MKFENGLTNEWGEVCDVILVLDDIDKAELERREYEALGCMGSYNFCDLVIDCLNEHPEINMTIMQDIDYNYLIVINIIGSSVFHTLKLHYDSEFMDRLVFKKV